MQESNKATEIEVDQELSDLINQFHKSINLIKVTESNETMATANQTVGILTEKELTMLISFLPEFLPGQNLALFINRVEELINAINLESANALYSYILLQGIKSRIKGDAANFVSYFNCKTWDEIKKVLLSKYGDQRSEQVLLNELDSLSQAQNETFQNFYHRIIATLNDLIQKTKLDNQNTAIFDLKRDMYTTRAINTFRLGVTEPYCSYLDKFELKSLEECLNRCITYENEKSIKDYHEFVRRRTSVNHQKPSQKPPANNFNPQTRNYFIPNFANKPQFPTGPINIQPRQMTQPQQFWTNRQVFGNKAKPVTGTTMSKLQNQSRPTPMSTSSKSNAKIFQPHPQSRPNFISKELFNCEIDPELQEVLNYYEPESENEEPSEITEIDDENFRETASELNNNP